MKIKLDENLPAKLIRILGDLGHDTDTVQHEGLATGRSYVSARLGRAGEKNSDDHHVWKATQVAKRFLITQDLDFSDIRRYTPGTHQGVMLVRLRDPRRRALAARIQAIFQTEDVERWTGCFVVITERKIRVRYPKG